MPPPASTSAAQAAQQTVNGASQILRLTLDDALARARKNSTQFLAAQTDAAIARQDRYQAGAALLPSVTYNNQAISSQFLLSGGHLRPLLLQRRARKLLRAGWSSPLCRATMPWQPRS